MWHIPLTRWVLRAFLKAIDIIEYMGNYTGIFEYIDDNTLILA